jgi:hypothetical protein
MINWMEENFSACVHAAQRQGWSTPGKRDVVTPREMWREYWRAMDTYMIVKRVLKGDYREARPQPPRVPKAKKVPHEEVAAVVRSA